MSKDKELPDDVKRKIEDEINVRYPEFTMTEQEINFRNGAEYGYSLAQEEIERLKGLIKDIHDGNWETGYNSGVTIEQSWQQFKQTHKL